MDFPSVPFHLHHPTWLQQQNLHLADDSLIKNHQQCSMLKCPRCQSTNTKFCYFNNYSLSQPRHFCKACRRYWTRGGALREVPIGGGCRRNNKKSKGTESTSSKSPITSTTTSIFPNTSNIMPLMTNKFMTNPSSYSNLPGFPAMPNVVELRKASGDEVGFQIGKVSGSGGTLDLSAAFSNDKWMSSSSNYQLNLNQLSCFSNRFEQPGGSFNLNPLAYDQVGFVDQSSIMKQEENQRLSNFQRLSGKDQYWRDIS